MELIVNVKNVYGNQLIYPVNDTAKLFCKLLNTKTLTKTSLNDIRSLGYTITVETPTL